MKSKRSRLALMMAMALVSCLTVGLLSGTAADAKKKKKKAKNVTSVTVSTTAPTVVPPTSTDLSAKWSRVSIPLVVGKQAKGKVVSPDSVAVTYSLAGSPPQSGGPGLPGSLWETDLDLVAPNGRSVDLDPPGFNDPNTSATGPTTETPDSSSFPCSVDGFPIPQPDVCDPTVHQDPDATLVPPAYAGTLGNNDLAFFNGVPAMGTWTAQVTLFAEDLGPSTLTSLSIRIGLVQAPSTGAKTGGKKKK
jgi:hypothetical protein